MVLNNKPTSLLSVLVGPVILVTPDPCFKVYSAVQNDMYMERHTYSKVGACSVSVCAAQCLMSGICLSFCYNKHSRICHLNDNKTIVDVVPRSDFIYSDISLWSKALAGTCSLMSCPVDSACHVDRLHGATCIPEFQGCGEPPDIPDFNKKYEGHFLSALVKYSCKTDYTHCNHNTTSVCRPSGQWDNVTGVCRRFRWYNRVTGRKFEMPCGPTDRFSAKIVATPIKAVRTTVNVVSGANILLQVDFRFRYSGMVNSTCLNSWFSGKWGKIITLKQMPLTVRKEFKMDLQLEDGVYTIMVDGAVIYNYSERSPGAKPEYIRITHDVSVQRVELSL